ncbi:MAG: histidine phosphatase family protein [Xanthobacteraceae bacterium]
MTAFFLVRHGAHKLLDLVLTGRMPGVELDDHGRAQAREAAEHLAGERISLVQSSPQPRTRDTAAVIAERANVALEIAAGIDEIDMGDWTGRSFASLREDPDWRRWNEARGSSRPPHGESMHELQQRILAHLEHTAKAHPDGRIAIVSHAEVIRAALLHVLKIDVNEFWRVEVAPGSISTVVMRAGAADVLALNVKLPTPEVVVA